MKALIAVALASGLVCHVVHAQEKPERDEPKAERFMFCMNVSQFFYQYLLKNDPQNPGMPGYRDGRIYYRMAATYLTDGQFMIRENERSLQRVIRILEKDRSENTTQMDDEAKSCAQTFANDVTPLIQKMRGESK